MGIHKKILIILYYFNKNYKCKHILLEITQYRNA